MTITEERDVNAATTTTATAAVLRGSDEPFVLEEVRLGPIRADELLIRVVGAGLCHTDLLLRDPQTAAALGPIVLGHEGAGIVEEVGDNVTGVRPGDHVLLSFDACGSCKNCLRGAPAYCDQFELRNVSGRRADGSTAAEDGKGGAIANRWFGQSTFATHAIATSKNVVVVDDDVPLELLGPLGCGLQTGAGSVLNEMRLGVGQSIAVFGAGGVGLAAVMAAAAAGASDIVVVDLHDGRLQTALELGATRVVRGDVADLASAVRGGGGGVDFSFETTSVSALIECAVAVLDRPGKAVLVGAGRGALSIPPALLAGRTVTYALEGSSVPQVFIPQLLALWRRGLFPFEKLIRTYALSDINIAEADSLSGATIKPVLIPPTQ